MNFPMAGDTAGGRRPFVLGRPERLVHLGFWIGLAVLGLVIGWLAFDTGKQIAINQSRPSVVIVLQVTPAQ